MYLHVHKDNVDIWRYLGNRKMDSESVENTAESIKLSSLPNFPQLHLQALIIEDMLT